MIHIARGIDLDGQETTAFVAAMAETARAAEVLAQAARQAHQRFPGLSWLDRLADLLGAKALDIADLDSRLCQIVEDAREAEQTFRRALLDDVEREQSRSQAEHDAWLSARRAETLGVGQVV